MAFDLAIAGKLNINEMKKVIVNEEKVVAENTTSVKFGAINQPTPQWAKWVFRGTFIITSAITLWIGGTQLIIESDKVEIMMALKSLDALVFGFSKMFGIVQDEDK